MLLFWTGYAIAQSVKITWRWLSQLSSNLLTHPVVQHLLSVFMTR
jgi:hypothetical protein